MKKRYILSIALGAAIIFGIVLIILLLVQKSQFVVNIRLDEDEVITQEELDFSANGITPGRGNARDYTINLKSKIADTYAVELEFSEEEDGGLRDFINVEFTYGDISFYSTLDDLFNGTKVGFNCEISKKNPAEIHVVFWMDERVGNEAQGTTSDFTILLTIEKGGSIGKAEQPETPKYYTVDTNYNVDHGTVSVSAAAHAGMYEKGEEVTVSVAAKAGYEIYCVLINATQVTLENGSYTFSVVTDTTVSVIFKSVKQDSVAPAPGEKNFYTVTLSATEGGAAVLSPASAEDTYEEGSVLTAVVVAEEGYEVASATIGGKELTITGGKYELVETEHGMTVVLSRANYSFPVTGDAQVKVTFKKIESPLPVPEMQGVTLKVSGASESNTARIVPGGEQEKNDTVNLLITHASGYKVTVLLNGKDITNELSGSNHLYSYFATVGQDLAFEVVFEEV